MEGRGEERVKIVVKKMKAENAYEYGEVEKFYGVGELVEVLGKKVWRRKFYFQTWVWERGGSKTVVLNSIPFKPLRLLEEQLNEIVLAIREGGVQSWERWLGDAFPD